jgi:hypothetical protein
LNANGRVMVTPLPALDGFPGAEWSIVLGPEKVSLVAKIEARVLATASGPIRQDDDCSLEQQVADVVELLRRLRDVVERKLALAKALNRTLDAEVFLEPIELKEE